MAGFGRCGEWFAVDHWDVTPDLITWAKGSNSGYLPIGGVVISQKIADTFKDKQYPGGLTYSGHVLACASVVASINIFKEEGIIEHARMLGTDVIAPALAKLYDKHPSIGEVRGLGVFWALDLVSNRETRKPLVPYNATGADAAPMVALVRRWPKPRLPTGPRWPSSPSSRPASARIGHRPCRNHPKQCSSTSNPKPSPPSRSRSAGVSQPSP